MEKYNFNRYDMSEKLPAGAEHDYTLKVPRQPMAATALAESIESSLEDLEKSIYNIVMQLEQVLKPVDSTLPGMTQHPSFIPSVQISEADSNLSPFSNRLVNLRNRIESLTKQINSTSSRVQL